MAHPFVYTNMDKFLEDFARYAKEQHDMTIMIPYKDPESGWFSVFAKDNDGNTLTDFDIRDLGEHTLAGRKADMCEVRLSTKGHVIVEQVGPALAGFLFL